LAQAAASSSSGNIEPSDELMNAAETAGTKRPIINEIAFDKAKKGEFEY